jgi:hypothetical protein
LFGVLIEEKLMFLADKYQRERNKKGETKYVVKKEVSLTTLLVLFLNPVA